MINFTVEWIKLNNVIEADVGDYRGRRGRHDLGRIGERQARRGPPQRSGEGEGSAGAARAPSVSMATSVEEEAVEARSNAVHGGLTDNNMFKNPK